MSEEESKSLQAGTRPLRSCLAIRIEARSLISATRAKRARGRGAVRGAWARQTVWIEAIPLLLKPRRLCRPRRCWRAAPSPQPGDALRPEAVEPSPAAAGPEILALA